MHYNGKGFLFTAAVAAALVGGALAFYPDDPPVSCPGPCEDTGLFFDHCMLGGQPHVAQCEHCKFRCDEMCEDGFIDGCYDIEEFMNCLDCCQDACHDENCPNCPEPGVD